MRLIDADILFDAMEETEWYNNADRDEIAERLIMDAPTIEIIRCVECRYKGMEICPMYKLTKAGVLKPYDFCSYGERNDDEGHN